MCVSMLWVINCRLHSADEMHYDNKYRVAIVFVNHFSDLSYIHMQTDNTSQVELKAKKPCMITPFNIIHQNRNGLTTKWNLMTFLIQTSGRNSHQNHNVSTKLGLSKVQQATSQNLMQPTYCTSSTLKSDNKQKVDDPETYSQDYSEVTRVP